MNPSRCLHRLTIGFISLLGVMAHAQDSKEPTRGVRFVCTSVAPQTPETLKLMSRKGLVDVQLSERSPGGVFQLPADGEILIGQASEDPQHPLLPYARAKLPAGVNEATALLIPVPKRPDGSCYHVILISAGELKGGDAYFLNLLEQKCAVRLDGKDLILSRGQPEVFHSKALDEPRNVSIAVSVQKSPKSWELITASTWRMRSTRIEICVIYWDTRYDRPSLKGLTIYPEKTGGQSE